MYYNENCWYCEGLSSAFLTWETSVMLFMWSVLKQIRGEAAAICSCIQLTLCLSFGQFSFNSSNGLPLEGLILYISIGYFSEMCCFVPFCMC